MMWARAVERSQQSSVSVHFSGAPCHERGKGEEGLFIFGGLARGKDGRIRMLDPDIGSGCWIRMQNARCVTRLRYESG